VTGDVLYRRTQIAWPTIAPLLFVAALLIPLFARMQLAPAVWITVAVYAIILLLFATLTVTVTSDGVSAAFGVGVVRKWIPFGEVESFARLRTQWFNGWGIHGYRGGTLYNASGLSAVEFRLRSGRYVAIGTAEPDALVAALAQAAGRVEAAHEPLVARRWTWGPQQTIGAAAGVFGVAVAIMAIYTTVQPPDAVVGFDSFYVGSGFYRNTIPYPSMRSVTLEQTLPRIGFKTNGSSIGSTLRGNFRVDGWGTSRLYINRNVPPFVVITTADTHVVVNFSDPIQTRRLYASLEAQMRRAAR
jgi:hypothetical protein